MTDLEYIQYILGYVKACKIKLDNVMGGAYIYAYKDTLLCSDSMGSTYYLIKLEYPTDKIICNQIQYLEVENEQEIIYFNQHLYNIMYRALITITNPNLLFERIEPSDQDAIIPSKSTDPAYRYLYSYSDNPTDQIVQYAFFNMIPAGKSDDYYIEIANDYYSPGIINTSIMRFTVLKKKPKCIIQVYRRVMNL